MELSKYSKDYQSQPAKVVSFPSVRFYWHMVEILRRANRKAVSGVYPAEDWVSSSEEVGQAIENLGTQISITGVSHVRDLEPPCVFIANHMSTLETFFLPCIIQPLKDVTFVVKESLVNYPLLGPILRSRDPITVARTNPREDLAAVMDGGKKHLEAGRSVIIFPQGTRYANVETEQFSSLGIKLARKANVPVIPIALKTNVWGTGFVKDIGWIRPENSVYIHFGSPVAIEGNGKEQQKDIVNFIKETFDSWSNTNAQA